MPLEPLTSRFGKPTGQHPRLVALLGEVGPELDDLGPQVGQPLRRGGGQPRLGVVVDEARWRRTRARRCRRGWSRPAARPRARWPRPSRSRAARRARPAPARRPARGRSGRLPSHRGPGRRGQERRETPGALLGAALDGPPQRAAAALREPDLAGERLDVARRVDDHVLRRAPVAAREPPDDPDLGQQHEDVAGLGRACGRRSTTRTARASEPKPPCTSYSARRKARLPAGREAPGRLRQPVARRHQVPAGDRGAEQRSERLGGRVAPVVDDGAGDGHARARPQLGERAPAEQRPPVAGALQHEQRVVGRARHLEALARPDAQRGVVAGVEQGGRADRLAVGAEHAQVDRRVGVRRRAGDEVADARRRARGQAHAGVGRQAVAVGGRRVAELLRPDGAPVALPVDERDVEAERLRHAHHGVVDRACRRAGGSWR